MNMLHPTLEKVRIASLQVYKELVKSNLSHLLDIEMDFNFDAIESISCDSHSETIFGAPLTQEGICTVNQLISHILKKRNIEEEGIFRRCGGALRQKRLQKELCSGTTVIISKEYNVHDVCGLLKQFCRELPQPVLTDQLRDLFEQTVHLSAEKRLNAVRLLLLLLPSANRVFFKDLIQMFTAVVANSNTNKMGSSNLATIFSPILLLPNDVSSEKFKSLIEAGTLSKCLEFMIDQGIAIFEPSEKLLSDCLLYLKKWTENRRQATMNQFISVTSLIPSTKFCSNDSATPKDYTQQQLALLKEQAKSMPQSGKNKKVLENIKRTDINTPLTKLKRDREQKAIIKETLKKSGKYQSNGLKSFGSAIKKLMTPNSEKVLRSGGSCYSSSKKRSLTKRKSISGSVLVNQFEVNITPNKQQLTKSSEVTEKPKTPKPVMNIKSNMNTPVASSPCRRSISMKASIKIVSPLPQSDDKADHNDNSQVVEIVEKKRSSSFRQPPPLPPKPSPATIKRKCSIYSLQEPPTQSEIKRRKTTVSTKSLPCTQLASFRFNVKPIPSPLVKLSNQRNVKLLRAKYESMSKTGSKIPRLIPSRQFTYPSDSEDGDENYVCLSSIPKLNFSAQKLESSRKQLSYPVLLKQKQPSISRRSSKSPRSLKPLPEDILPYMIDVDSNVKISARKQRRRRRDLNLQPQTPL